MSDPPRADDDATQVQVATWDVPDPKPTNYASLARPFDHIFKDTRGGVTFDYPTGEQVRSRLNEELGPGGCEIRVKHHFIHPEADEVMVLVACRFRIIEQDLNLPGELVATWVTKENWGSQKIKRSKSTGVPLDLGFDYKGAETDAVKKCAAEIGIGLYLWKKAGGYQTVPDDNIPAGAVWSDANGTPLEAPTPIKPQGPRQQRQQRQPAQPQTPPASASPESTARYEAIRAEAVAAGFKASWLDAKSEGWTQPQVDGYTRQLESFLAKTQKVEARAS